MKVGFDGVRVLCVSTPTVLHCESVADENTELQ